MKQLLPCKYFLPQSTEAKPIASNYSFLCYVLPAFFMFFLAAEQASAQLTKVWETPPFKHSSGSGNSLVEQEVDGAGNLIILGSGLTLYKYDAIGRQLWVNKYEVEGSQPTNAGLWLDKSDNSYVLWGSLLLKYSPNGNLIWNYSFDYTQGGIGSVSALTMDEEGNVYVTGRVDNGDGTTLMGTQKMSATGAVIWTSVATDSFVGDVIEVDNKGGVYVLTSSNSIVPGNETIVLFKYNGSTGTEEMQQFYHTPRIPTYNETPRKLLISKSGEIYAFVDMVRGANEARQLFLYKAAANGVLIYKKGLGKTDEATLFDAVFAANEDIIVLGRLLKYRTTWDHFMTRVNPNADHIWYHTFNVYEEESMVRYFAPSADGFAVKADGSIAISGSYSRLRITPFSAPEVYTEYPKLIVATFNKDGIETWRQLLEHTTMREGNSGVSFINDKSFYFTGAISTLPAFNAPVNLVAARYQDCSGFTASAGTDKQICAGGNVQLQASGGTTYTWSPATGLSATNVANPIASPTQTTTYTVTVTNADGCTATDQVVVTVNPTPTAKITAGGATTFCTGGSVVLTADAGTGYSYQWMRNGSAVTGATNNTYTATTAGNYTVVVKAGNCSATSAAVAVNVTTGITASAGEDKTICAGGSAQLQATGGTTYSWSPATGLSATNVANPTASLAQTTTYTVTVSNGNGCTATDQVTVTVNAAPAATITASGATTFCDGGSVTLTANTGSGYSYQWLKDGNPINNATARTFTTAAAGDFSVRITNSNRCTATSAVTKVMVTTPPTVIAGQDQSVCVNATALTLTGFSPAGGTWSGPGVSANGLFNPATAGVGSHTLTYTVTQNSCTVSATKVITVTPGVASSAGSISGEAMVCAGAPNLTYSIPAVSGATNYTWTVPNGFTITSGQGTRIITVSAGTTSGSISVRAQNGCGSSDPSTIAVNVSVIPTASITTGGSTTLCTGSSVTLTANAGTGYSYQWLRNGSAISNATGTTYSANTAGDYAVVVRNAEGCSATSTAVRVTMASGVTASAGDDKAICAGGSAQLQATGGTTYSWSPATGLSATNISNPVASPTQTTTYTVTVMSANGCTATDQVTVTVNQAPSATIIAGGETSFCEGGSVTLSATTGANYSYQWQRNGATIAGATAATYNATTSGNYSVIISNGNCSATATPVAVNVTSSISNNTISSGNQTMCAGAAAAELRGSVPAGGSGTYTYQWQQSANGNNYTNIQGATSQNYSPGNLSASAWFRRVVSAGGCSSTSEAVRVTINPVPVVTLGAFSKVCTQDEALTLTGGQPGGGTYSGPGVEDGVFNPATAGPGTHTITYTYSEGGNCSASATQTIVVEECVTGVEDEEPPHKFVMFPNPAKDNLYLEVDLPQRTDVSIRLVDVRGRVILQQEYAGKAGAFTRTLKLGEMARGVYILQFTTKDGMYSRRVVLW